MNSNIVQLKAELDTLEVRVQSLRAQLEATSEKPENPWLWEPKAGEKYWATEAEGNIFETRWDGDEFDHARFPIGNCWPTREIAVEKGVVGPVSVYLREVAKWNHSHGWVCDWGNHEQVKWKFGFSHEHHGLFRCSCFSMQYFPTDFYFCEGFQPSEEAKPALLKWLGVGGAV